MTTLADARSVAELVADHVGIVVDEGIDMTMLQPVLGGEPVVGERLSSRLPQP